MSFKELDIKREYRSFKNDIIKEFYIPTLRESVLYRRAVGFFSSSALAEISTGIADLVLNNGRMEIIASPKLSDEDIEAIEKGYKLRQKVIEDNLISQLTTPLDYVEGERLNLLAHLIADNRLDIKIALISGNEGSNFGMYHEKLGLLYDKYDNKIAFSGSLNETANALKSNYESIDVFTSWNEWQRVEDKEKVFEEIWENREYGLEVVDVPNVKLEIIKRYKKNFVNYRIDYVCSSKVFEENDEYNNKPHIPNNIKLHDYQLEAIKNWAYSDYKGIFDMATGTGKTFTGIGGIVKLYEELKGKIAIVIVCPYTHLVEQWVEDLKLFGIKPIVAYGESSDKNYKKKIKDSVINYNLGVIDYFCIITTNATYRSEYIQESLKRLKKDALFVVDEAHNFGAINLQNKLLKNFNYRLALSATLDRHNDEDGTKALYDYFGNKCIEYDLERAIREKKLTPYNYYPVKVYLTDSELNDYKQLSKEIGKNIIIRGDGKKKLNEKAKMLLLKRARLIAGAQNKSDLLKELIENYKNDNHILVYCGATKVLEDDFDYYDEGIRQIDYITEMLGDKLGMKVSQFTSKEDKYEREIIKQKFSDGEDLQVLVAIKCLDEGVNIPKIKTAFILASTTNPKEYIQRRGRVLRLAPGKEFANIYDFITLPREIDSVSGNINEELKFDEALIKNEVRRIIEFKKLAINSFESDKLISELQEAYGIDLYTIEMNKGD